MTYDPRRRVTGLVNVIIHNGSRPPVLLRLDNNPQPGRPQNYEVVTICPAPDAMHAAAIAEVDPDDVVPVPRSEVEEIMRLLRESRIPPAPARSAMGLDGVWYEVFFGSGLNGSRFWWWLHAPPGWEPLATVVGRMRAYTRRYI